MKRSSLSTWVYVLLVFASGAALGVFSDRIYETSTVAAKSVTPSRDPGESRRKHMEELRTRLKLDGKQAAQAALILEETNTQIHDLIQKYKPEMTAIHNAQVARVKAMLSDSQRVEYQKLLDERAAKRLADDQKNASKK